MEDRLGVVGAGTMGAGIAALAARHGVNVTLVDSASGALDRARTRIEREAERAGDPAMLDRVTFATGIDALTAASFAIEAVPEDLALKQRIFAALEAHVAPEAILATNTSALPVEAIGAGLAHRERFAGVHFFNPPTAMVLVEIVRAPQTSDATIAAAHALALRLGRTPVDVADTPGFIVNRVARPFYLQALRALERGVASAAALDTLARGAGFAMGPFALMDLIGLDVNYAVSTAVYDRLHAPRLLPHPLQARMIAEGRLGRKTQRGFFDYPSAPDVPAPAAAAAPAVGARLMLLDPDGVLAPLRASAARRGVRVETSATLGAAATSGLPVVYDAYRFTGAELAAAGAGAHAGLGVLGPLEDQTALELIGDANIVAPLIAGRALELVAVRELPGLFLGAAVASIVNEAIHAREEGVAGEAGIDLALTLGVRYPRGPFAWLRRIGPERVAAMLAALAREDAAFGAHPALLHA